MSAKTEWARNRSLIMRTAVDGRPSLTWRGHGGGVPTLSSVEFDKQLDKISLWLEKWDHDTRCQILESLLVRSDYSQLQFLWTVIQPAMHRDFMYTAKKEFPRQSFLPISTTTSREVKRKLEHSRQNNFHRVKSAYIQHYYQVKEATSEVRELSADAVRRSPEVKGSPSTSETVSTNSEVSWEMKGDGCLKLPSIPFVGGLNLDKKFKSCPSLSRPNTMSSKQKCNHMCRFSSVNSLCSRSSRGEAVPAAVFDGESKDCNCHTNTAPPSLRFINMPIRRHIQYDRSAFSYDKVQPTYEMSIPRPTTDTSTHSRSKNRSKQSKGVKQSYCQDDLHYHIQMPVEGCQLVYWYTNLWDDLKRSEFLHKLLLKLDPRQHYFMSSFLSLRQYRDFIALLSEHLALKILSYLNHKELINASRVSGTWSALCNHNDLWRRKCLETQLKIPVTGQTPVWKQIYKDNMFLKQNWSQGRCKIIDCKGHSDRVLSVIFDQKRMATGSLDRTIKIWNLDDGRCLQTLKGHSKGVWCLCFFTKNLLISGAYDATIRIWNMKDGCLKRTLLGHEGPVWAIVRRENILVSASQDRTGKIWDISRCLLLHTLRGHNGAVFAADMDEQGKLAVTASADKSVRIWDVATGEQRRVIWVGHSTAIMTVSYSKGWLACSYGNTINIYRGNGAKLVRTYDEHEKRVESIQLKISNPDLPEGTFVSAGQDGVVKYWNINREKSVQTLAGHHQRVNCIYFDETRIASAACDNKIKLWDFNV